MESVSAFFPAYNDASTIGGLVEKAVGVLRHTGRDFEVIVVNDGSTDDTPRILVELQARYAGVLRVVHHTVNRGYGGALRSGFGAATKDLVFYTDGDGQYDPSELALLLQRLEPELGLVNGYKIKRHDPFHRIVIGKVYNLFVRLLFRIRVKDVDCDFRLIRREYLRLARLESDTGAICVELLRELEGLGCKSADVPVHHYPRLSGQSQFFRWRSVSSTIRQLTALYFRPRPTMQPARELWGPNAK
ncbi:MAG: glycosyltransferase family 2 protein [Acidobacteria bacterium]|nr:glycosyltransferase family 2 protein [Acidobacteriota bacterium]